MPFWKKNYNEGDRVIMLIKPLKDIEMEIVGSQELVKGWKYKLAFLTKKGVVDKRRTNHWWSFENEFVLKAKQ